VWIEADVYEQELPYVVVGSRATVRVDSYPDRPLTGRAVSISPYLDDKTRTSKVRFAFANPDGRLKPGMYANVSLISRAGTGLLVPIDAVLDSGAEQYVFVAEGDGRFEPRRVKAGHQLRDVVQILEGVSEGE